MLTPAIYDYQFVPEVKVSDKNLLTFRVKAASDAHIALSATYGEIQLMTYEITLGGLKNRRSSIRYGGDSWFAKEARTPSVLSETEMRPFWISWENGVLDVGEGMRKGSRRLLQWRPMMEKRHNINHLSVCTSEHSKGEWEFIEYLGNKVLIVLLQNGNEKGIIIM